MNTEALSSDSAIETPGLPRRLAAMVYDSLLLIAVGLAYGAVVTFLNVLVQGVPPEGQAITWGPWRPAVFAGMIAVWIGFFYYFWGRSGQTLGMRAWRLKLVDDETGGPVAGRQRLARAFLAMVSLGLCGLGYVWSWVDPAGHTLHGRLTHTRVVLLPKEKR